MKRKAVLVCCSDPRKEAGRQIIIRSAENLEKMGVRTKISNYLGSETPVDACIIAQELMSCFADDKVTDIFDVSGGDIANRILPHLDYELVRHSNACFYGYSDLTTIINALYAQTGKESVLYQVKNIASDQDEIQCRRLDNYLSGNEAELLDINCCMINGRRMSGTLIGGNIRCLLKLAGTPYMPDPEGKLLLLEALGTDMYQLQTYVSQLSQLGFFSRIKGILLGTFTKLDNSGLSDDVINLILKETNYSLPAAKTEEIGHGKNSKAAVIGRKYIIDSDITENIITSDKVCIHASSAARQSGSLRA